MSGGSPNRPLVEVAVSLRNEGISAGSYVTFLKEAALNVRLPDCECFFISESKVKKKGEQNR